MDQELFLLSNVCRPSWIIYFVLCIDLLIFPDLNFSKYVVGMFLKENLTDCNRFLVCLMLKMIHSVVAHLSSESRHTNQLCSISHCDSDSLLNEVWQYLILR